MNAKSLHRPFSLWVLILLLVLLGLGALAGGAAFLLKPDGSVIQMPLSNLEKTPFPDFFIPGLILFALLGVYPLLVAYSLWRLPGWRWPDRINPFKQKHWSWAAALASGVIVIIWITVQLQMISYSYFHGIYLAWGALIILAALLPGVRAYCRRAAR